MISPVDRFIPDGSTAFYRASVVDQDGGRIDSSDIDSITLTIYDVDSGAIINSRDAQDVNGANGGTYTYQTAAITAASYASPIVVTSAGHGRTTGDRVNITGVYGNTAANGTWRITAESADTFSLDNSSGNAEYVSGGDYTYSRFEQILSAADNVIVGTVPANAIQVHRALFVVTYDTSKKIVNQVELYVRQIDKN